jgi:hypothetical protein
MSPPMMGRLRTPLERIRRVMALKGKDANWRLSVYLKAEKAR